MSAYTAQYRPYVPVSIAIYSGLESKSWTLVAASEFSTSRDINFSASLPAGIFAIIPLCGTPTFIEDATLTKGKDTFPIIHLDEETGKHQATNKFDDTLNEIFNRFDLIGEGCLKHSNCKMILDSLDLQYNELEFNESVLKKNERLKGGLSIDGFKDWIVQTLAEKDDIKCKQHII